LNCWGRKKRKGKIKKNGGKINLESKEYKRGKAKATTKLTSLQTEVKISGVENVRKKNGKKRKGRQKAEEQKKTAPAGRSEENQDE